MTATVGRVSPNPKRTVSDEDAERIKLAMVANESAYAALRNAVLGASANGAGVRSLSELTGLSTSTIQRWKSESL